MKLSIIALSASLIMGASANADSVAYESVIGEYSIYSVRMALMNAGDHGLYQSDYWTMDMEREYRNNPNSYALKNMANRSYLKMLQHISTGVVDPALVSSDIKLTKKKFVSADELSRRIMLNGGDLERTTETFSSRIPEYVALRKAHRQIQGSCNSGVWKPLPSFAGTLGLGSRNSVVYDIKGRLMLMGYDIDDHSNTMDSNTVNIIKEIQWNLRFTPDGKISSGGKTFKYLNASCEERARQIRTDMEKLRWFPQDIENRYIFVNIAMSYLNLVDRSSGYSEFMNLRTITGRPARKTPTLRDRIVNVVINPFWVVPPTIFKEDKVEDLKQLSPSDINNYFAKSNYEVVNKDFTQTIDPSTIDWNSVTSNNANFYIRQKPHAGNALGGLKFNLTNSFAIYLHDTNQRQLLQQAQRQLSSGCVRVEKPVELASYLLQGTSYSQSTIENLMAKPGEVLDKATTVKVNQAMPVYMAYLTSQAGRDGSVRFTEDDYEQNIRINRLGVR